MKLWIKKASYRSALRWILALRLFNTKPLSFLSPSIKFSAFELVERDKKTDTICSGHGMIFHYEETLERKEIAPGTPLPSLCTGSE